MEKEETEGGRVDKEGRHCHARVFHRLFHPRLCRHPPLVTDPAPRPLVPTLCTPSPPRRESSSSSSGGGSGGGGGGGGSVFLITTAIFFSSRDDAVAKRYRNISPPINPKRFHLVESFVSCRILLAEYRSIEHLVRSASLHRLAMDVDARATVVVCFPR